MKILIVGASGFIASALIRLLAQREDTTIIAGVRRPSTCAFPPGVELRKIEAIEPHTIANAMRGVTHVVNCVMGTAEVMRNATSSILDSALKQDIERVVHISSVAVYGKSTGQIDEDHEFVESDWYSATKIADELAVRSAVQRGLDVVTLRPALVYGPGSLLWSRRIARLLVAHRLGDLGALGDGLCNLIHVHDVAQAIVRAAILPGIEGRVFNLSDPDPPTWNSYLMHFGRALGAVPISRIPSWQLELEHLVLAPVYLIAQKAADKLGIAHLAPQPITPGLASLFGLRARYDSGRADILSEGERIDWRIGVADVAAELLRTRPAIGLSEGEA